MGQQESRVRFKITMGHPGRRKTTLKVNMCCISYSGSAQQTYLVENFTFNMDSIELNTTGILSSR